MGKNRSWSKSDKEIFESTHIREILTDGCWALHYITEFRVNQHLLFMDSAIEYGYSHDFFRSVKFIKTILREILASIKSNGLLQH